MDYKSYFDIPDNITYLNTPGNGLMPRAHHAWRRAWEMEFFDVAGDRRDQQPAFIAQVKREFGALFNCSTEEVYLTPNFSFAMHTLLDGLPSGLKYAILEEDYPSLNFPVISRQLDYVKIKVDQQVEEHIQNTIRNQHIDVLLLSVVQYINGLMIDLNFINKLKAEFPDLIIVGDATQYLGTEPLNFKDSGFDAIGGSGYKWMMAGFGNGYMMVSDQLQAILYQKAQSGPRPHEAMWSSKSILDTFFEPGHQDTLSHGTLLRSLNFMQTHGLDHIQAYLIELRAYAYGQFDERGWLLPEIRGRNVRSSLVNLQIDPKNYDLLLANGIKCFPRGRGIRIGLHVYNTQQDVDKLIEVIEKINR